MNGFKAYFPLAALFVCACALLLLNGGATAEPVTRPAAPLSLSTPDRLQAHAVIPAFHKRRAPVFIGHAVLSWHPNTDDDLAGYKIHYGTAPRTYGPPADVGNVTTHTVGRLQVGVTYYFAVTAYDAAGNESGFSNEVRQTIQ